MRPRARHHSLFLENDYDKEVYNGDIGYIDGVGSTAKSCDRVASPYGFSGDEATFQPNVTYGSARRTPAGR